MAVVNTTTTNPLVVCCSMLINLNKSCKSIRITDAVKMKILSGYSEISITQNLLNRKAPKLEQNRRHLKNTLKSSQNQLSKNSLI